MMNILFLNNAEISPISNGIQRVTHVLSEGFSSYQGALCFSAYFKENDITPKTWFHNKLLLVEGHEFELLSAFIIENKIDIVICQQLLINQRIFSIIQKAVAQRENCKSFYCLHSCPTFVFIRPNIYADLFRLTHRIEMVKSLKKVLVGILPKFVYTALVQQKTHQEYSLIQAYFDKTVLLSQSNIKPYIELCNNQNDISENVKFINNPLSFGTNITKDELSQKQQEVIIVSRLSDRSKRIALALRIWQKVKNDPIAQYWNLTIIGTGEDEAYYKYLAKKLSLKNVTFTGRQEPSEYYRKSSICLITSAYEGWGMNIIEALQTGTVPIAFDSYDALHDILEDGFNGLIIPNNDVKKYVQGLLWLMQNKAERQEIACRGIESCNRFSLQNITRQWMDLFRETIKTK